MEQLSSQLGRLVETSVLLVASDFDGTLSPIAPHPALARPDGRAIAALRALAVMPRTHVAVISGRARGDLAAVSGLGNEVHLVGSHGGEFDAGFAKGLDAALLELRDQILAAMRSIAGDGRGFVVETKPASVALHYRQAPGMLARDAVERILQDFGQDFRIQVRHGKDMIELSVVASDKGTALAAIRTRVGASGVLFVGDDQTDEDAFAVLSGGDVGIKVGEGATQARFRIRDTAEVAGMLATLAEQRKAVVQP